MINATTAHSLVLALVGAALATACSVPATDEGPNGDTDVSASAYGSTIRGIDSDSYQCVVSDGRTTSTATLSRSLFERIHTPGDKFINQDLRFSDSVFQGIVRKNGPYGCAHSDGSGWSLSSRENHVVGDKLTTMVSFSTAHEQQWANCNYNANETLSITGQGNNVALSYRIANGSAPQGGYLVTGTCAKVAPAQP